MTTEFPWPQTSCHVHPCKVKGVRLRRPLSTLPWHHKGWPPGLNARQSLLCAMNGAFWAFIMKAGVPGIWYYQA